MKKDKEKKLEPGDPSTGMCGSQPTRPGSSNPGEWDCQDGTWVWVEDIGGGR